MMKLFLAVVLACSLLPQSLSAQTTESLTYTRGEVTGVISQSSDTQAGLSEIEQTVLVKLLGGPDEGEIVTLTYVMPANYAKRQELEEKDLLIIAYNPASPLPTYAVVDRFRLPGIFWLVAIFALLAIVFGGWRGLTSMIGLGTSLLILIFFVIPRIFAGDSPFVVALVGGVVIATISLFLAHGINRRSTLALAATLIALISAVLLAVLSTHLLHLTGMGSEQALYLQLGYLPDLDLRGLLLAGMIIGVLGILDDVTTAQVAAIQEIAKANTTLSFRELYKRGLSVGREHIAALINTLVLVYAGTSFPLFLLFAVPGGPPFWVVMNSENILEEIAPALVGGSALIIAVPIATLLAAYFFRSQSHRLTANG